MIEVYRNNRERNLAIIQDMTLMDDIFMTVFFDNQPKCMEEVLGLILPFKVNVLEVKTQSKQSSIYGRSVIFDILARDADNTAYDIEIQKANKGATVKRARYHSSLLDTESLKSGEDFDSINDTYVIFITESDVLKGNQPLYTIERKITQTDEFFGDGEHIIYINTSYKGSGDYDIEKLIKYFTTKRADEIENSVLHERFDEMKNGKAEKEADIMCELLEKVAQEERAEGRAEGRAENSTEIAKNMLAMNIASVEVIAQVCNLTIDEVNQIKEQLTT